MIETNWRATHILTGNQDVAIIPNSVIAKSRLVNCSTPTMTHGASIRVKLEPSLTPAAGCNLLKEVLLGSTHILRTPEPTVTIKDLSAEMIDFELSYSVADISAVDRAQNELFDRVFRAVAAAGAKFSPRLGRLAESGRSAGPRGVGNSRTPACRNLAFLDLDRGGKGCAGLADAAKGLQAGRGGSEGRHDLASLMHRQLWRSGWSAEANGRKIEVIRLAPGDYFGEVGLLTGEQPLRWRTHRAHPGRDL